MARRGQRHCRHGNGGIGKVKPGGPCLSTPGWRCLLLTHERLLPIWTIVSNSFPFLYSLVVTQAISQDSCNLSLHHDRSGTTEWIGSSIPNCESIWTNRGVWTIDISINNFSIQHAAKVHTVRTRHVMFERSAKGEETRVGEAAEQYWRRLCDTTLGALPRAGPLNTLLTGTDRLPRFIPHGITATSFFMRHQCTGSPPSKMTPSPPPAPTPQQNTINRTIKWHFPGVFVLMHSGTLLPSWYISQFVLAWLLSKSNWTWRQRYEKAVDVDLILIFPLFMRVAFTVRWPWWPWRGSVVLGVQILGHLWQHFGLRVLPIINAISQHLWLRPIHYLSKK